MTSAARVIVGVARQDSADGLVYVRVHGDGTIAAAVLGREILEGEQVSLTRAATGTWAASALGSGARDRWPRQETTKTTPSMSPGSEVYTSVDLAVGFRLHRLTTDIPARVRLYATGGAMVADALRPVGTDPVGNHGLICEFVTTETVSTLIASPMVDGASMGSPPSETYALAVQNLSDSVTGTVSVTFAWVQTEGILL